MSAEGYNKSAVAAALMREAIDREQAVCEGKAAVGREPGTRVTVDVNTEGFHVRHATGRLRSFRFPESETALLEGMTAETAHADQLADPSGRELSP